MNRLPPLPLPPVRGAGKARFFASLGLMLMVVAVAGRRFGLIDTDTLLLSVALALLATGLALLFVGVTLADIWREGRHGGGSLFGTILLVLATLTPPAAALAAAIHLPAIDAVSTDLDAPPSLPVRAERLRLPIHLVEPAERQAELQTAGYPDIAPQFVDASAPDAFALARASLAELGWTVTDLSEPLTETAGRLVATGHSLIIGTPFDLVVRVSPNDDGTRLDVRSVSRDGLPDLGENARNVRSFFAKYREIERRPTPG